MANGDSFLGTVGSDLSGIGSGLGKILSNPLAQAALGTYFGAISSPAYLGWGGALGRGGLAGLSEFAQARQLQAQQPKLQAETQLDVTKVQQAQQQMAVRQQMLDWLDKDPAAQKMEPQQRMILRLAATGGHLAPGVLGLTPYQQGQLAQSTKRTDIEQERERVEAQRAQAETDVSRARLAGTLPPAPESPDLAQQRQATISLAQARQRQLESGAPQLTKINTDLGRFSQFNPLHWYTTTAGTQKWVDDAVKYASNLNPGADPNAIRQSAEALARMPDTTANTPTAAHGSNPTATGPGGKRVQWNGTAWVPMGG